MQVNNLTDELVAVIGKCSLTPNKQEVTFKYIKDIIIFPGGKNGRVGRRTHTPRGGVLQSPCKVWKGNISCCDCIYVHIYNSLLRGLVNLCTFRCGIVPEGDLGEKKSEGDEVERRKKVRVNVEPASLLEDAVSILNEMVEQSDQDVELAEAAMNEEEGEVEIELFAL